MDSVYLDRIWVTMPEYLFDNLIIDEWHSLNLRYEQDDAD
jgi:hypothetical protein